MYATTFNAPRFIKIRNFQVVKELNGSSTLVDYSNKIVKVEWEGIVDLATATLLFNASAELVENGQCDKVLLNRKNLTEFTTEARIWIKQEFLKNRSKQLDRKIMKVATVRSISATGSIFSNYINRGIKLVFPRVTLSKFDTEHEAVNWLVAK